MNRSRKRQEHNKASNRFVWTALNSGASDATPATRPSLTFSSADLNSGESQALGKISMTLYVSSTTLSVAESDISFTNGVINNYTKVSNNYYTFDFTSATPSQASTIFIIQDTLFNRETGSDFNQSSNTFEWTGITQ